MEITPAAGLVGLRRLSTILTFAVVFTGALCADTQGGYSHDANQKTTNTDWMAALTDSVRLSQLSIPGTHDTMLYDIDSDRFQTQSMRLASQLQSGIRSLDIRCILDEERLAIYDGTIVSPRSYLDDVLNEVTSFLSLHPKETILIRITKEHSSNARTFERVFRDNYFNAASYSSFFWRPTGLVGSNDALLGQVRGKIVVLENFPSTTTPGTFYGLDWTAFTIQDNYNLSSNAALYDKWTAVRNLLTIANDAPRNIVFVNFLNGGGISYPYFVASGKSSSGTNAALLLTGLTQTGSLNRDKWPDFPRVSCFLGTCSIAYLGTNQLTVNWLNSHPTARTGIVYADFPGPDLINKIIQTDSIWKR
jgi:1-phosphatidylinositol phosphodiesterase